ncbi:hypothetical protein [Amycolatopsis sp. cmx-11-51]|uniref:hypothetical protein n=1 Tax=unclassified Amycolatopsis TaxID=2618356 RepID=UPI0039E403E9
MPRFLRATALAAAVAVVPIAPPATSVAATESRCPRLADRHDKVLQPRNKDWRTTSRYLTDGRASFSILLVGTLFFLATGRLIEALGLVE